jgi:hypothetical protein
MPALARPATAALLGLLLLFLGFSLSDVDKRAN